MNSLAARRYASLNARLTSLTKEIDHWKTITADPALDLGRHNSQVRRLETTLGSMLEPLQTAIENTDPDSADVLKSGEGWEKEILAAHSIWEIFRSKLVVRQDELFRAPLAACDDLAWSCYRPAMEQFAPKMKGPPLVFLSTTWSPFAQTRDTNFLNDVRASPGTTSALTGDAFQQVLNRLPIPLLGLPWYQTFYMPGALLLAHEVGHIVEGDFGLTKDIDDALVGAKPDHLAIWQGWASEAFADVYGTVTMGPYFVGALIDFLATTVTAIQGDVRKSGKYPTRALRIELALQVLERTGYAAAVPSLRTAWESVYGAIEQMKEFVSDTKVVARALCDGPYKGNSAGAGVGLAFAAGVRPADTATIEKIAKLAAAGDEKNLRPYTSPQFVFAAAQWLHENPQPAQKPTADSLLVAQAVKKYTRQVRAVRNETAAVTKAREQAAAQERAEQEAADRATGLALRDLLLKSEAGDPPPEAEPPDPQES